MNIARYHDFPSVRYLVDVNFSPRHRTDISCEAPQIRRSIVLRQELPYKWRRPPIETRDTRIHRRVASPRYLPSHAKSSVRFSVARARGIFVPEASLFQQDRTRARRDGANIYIYVASTSRLRSNVSSVPRIHIACWR